MPSRRHLLTLLAAVAASAFATPPALAVGGLVDLQVVDRDRQAVLTTWRHRGATYVAGRPGDRYAVRMTNRTGERVLVVLSVDGVNAVSGETAATAQTGYVLAPWQSTDITGWRKSAAEAAAFYFTALPDSYAARTDRPDHVGVIGAAVFRERVAPPPPPRPFEAPSQSSRDRADRPAARESVEGRAEGASERKADDNRAAAPASSSDMARATRPAEKLGTGHGEREYSPVTRTAFERATARPSEVVSVRYDSHANLLAAGIIGRSRHSAPADPFPGFVPDPR